MAVMQNSIVFGGVDSADYGIYIGGEGVFNAPKRDAEMISIPGRNGAFALDKGRFENIEVEYSAFNYESDLATFSANLEAFRNAICSKRGYQRLTDTFHTDEYRMAAYIGGLEIKPVDYNTASTFTITFDCMPQRYLTSGEEAITIGEWGDTETASGTIAEFEAVEGDGVKSLVADIEPIQDLHGYDKPWAGGAGKNLLPNEATTVTITGITFTVRSDGSVNVTGTNTGSGTASLYLKNGTGWNLPAGEYILTGTPAGGGSSTYFMSLYYGNNGGNNWGAFDFGSGQTYTLTSSTNTDLGCRIGVAAGTTINKVFYPMLRKSTASAEYEPYSNICPISGYDSVVVTVADDHDSPTVSNTYTTSLSGTRYGGTLDVVSGVLTVTDGNIASYNGETLPSTWISDRDVYASGTTPTTGAQVVYELDTPTTVQLTAQEAELLVGLNQIWANSGDVTVEYGTAPNVVVNPTLFEARPMLEVEGYGTIAFNGYEIELDNAVMGEVELVSAKNWNSATWRPYLMPKEQEALYNSGDTLTLAKTVFDFSLSSSNYATSYLIASATASDSNALFSTGFVRVSGSYTYFKTTISPLTFTAGTYSTITDTVTINATMKDASTKTFTVSIYFSYEAVGTEYTDIHFGTSATLPQYYYDHFEGGRGGALTVNSTVSALGHPTYIDCDLGEAYMIKDNVPISLDAYIDLGSDLPCLAVGANEFTYDNTVTDLKVIPRWWKV